MKKRIWIVTLSLLATILLIMLLTPYYLGGKAEDQLRKQQAFLAKTTFLSIDQYQYERGWFSSTETFTVRIKPEFLSSLQQKMPDNVRQIFNDPITVVSQVRHGLFAGSLQPVLADVQTQFTFTPRTQQTLMRFFGQQDPITMNNTIGLSGGGDINIAVPAFNYEELSGIKLHWQGLTVQINYNDGYAKYDSHILNPGMELILADKGNIGYEQLSVNTHTDAQENNLDLGNSNITLKQLNIKWNDNFSYNVKLNELINLVSELQIGAFINPTGSFTPSQVSLHDLAITTKTSGSGQWIDANGSFAFEKLLYGDDQYGPFKASVSAQHLDASSLLKLKNKIAQLSTTNLDSEGTRTALIQAAQNEGLGLFMNDPLLKLNQFELQTPHGLIQAKGELSFKGLEKADLQQWSDMVKKTNAQLNASLPAISIENLAVGQARQIFTVDPTIKDENALEDIDETIRLLVQSYIKSMNTDGYIHVKDGVVNLNIKVDGNGLSFNGKTIINEPEEDFWDNDPAVSASSAKSEKTLPTQAISP